MVLYFFNCKMSLRNLRRHGSLSLTLAEESSSDGEDAAPAPVSAFSMMMSSSSSSSDESEAEEEEEDASASKRSEAAAAAPKKQAPPRRKPTPAGKGKKVSAREQRALAAASAAADDLALREALSARSSSSSSSGPSVAAAPLQTGVQAILELQAVHLIEGNEMRRKFGAAAVSSEAAEAAAHSKKQRRGGGNHPRAKRRTGKRRVLVPPKKEWPTPPSRIGGGIGMALDRTAAAVEGEHFEPGAKYFTFEWSEDYVALQADYLARVSTNDPNMIRDLLYHAPHHVDSLLQLSVVSDSYGQRDSSAELLRRCLFVLESAWHPAFAPLECDCRVLYSTRENRAFFTALFLHMSAVGRKGCSRTALELAKFILRLDPAHDPKGILLCIDHYALKAPHDGHPFLEALLDPTQCALSIDGVPLRLLPNLLYSRALSRHLRALVGEGGAASGGGSSSSDDAGGDDQSPDFALRQALITFPDVLLPLLEACECASEGRWRAVLGAAPFVAQRPLGTPGARGGEMLSRIVGIYLVRSAELWQINEKRGLHWLHSVATRLVRELAEDGAALTDGLAAAREKVREAYEIGSPLERYRGKMVSEFQDDIQRLPENFAPDAAGGAARGGDPAALQRQLEAAAAAQGGEGGNQLDPNTNPLLLFFQSLMPWNVVAAPDAQQQPPQPPPEPDADAADGDAAQ